MVIHAAHGEQPCTCCGTLEYKLLMDPPRAKRVQLKAALMDRGLALTRLHGRSVHGPRLS